MMDKNVLFVAGMFRSGTTMLARMLNSHSKVAFSSDPFAPLFKAFRNSVELEMGIATSLDLHRPLDDYYFDPQQLKLYNNIKNSSLKMPLKGWNLEEMRKMLSERMAPYSLDLSPRFLELEGASFSELFSHGFQLISEVYGDDNTDFIGFKDVWVNEFIPQILGNFENSKAIILLRDPRAVCASNNSTEQKYPWLFLIRQWRKLAAISWSLANNENYSNRVLVLKYEDLVSNPDKHISQICEFTGIELEETLLDPSSYTDGSGKKWIQNTSFGNGEIKFNTKGINQWKSVLTPDEVVLIETLTYAEMTAYGYEIEKAESCLPDASMIAHPLMIEESETADWIKPYIQSETELVKEMSAEFWRSSILMGNSEVTQDIQDLLFVESKLYEDFRKGI